MEMSIFTTSELKIFMHPPANQQTGTSSRAHSGEDSNNSNEFMEGVDALTITKVQFPSIPGRKWCRPFMYTYKSKWN